MVTAHRLRLVLLGVLTVIVTTLLVVVGHTDATYAVIGAGAVLGLGLLSIDMSLLPVVAFPAMLVLQRVGGALSVSDFVLFVCTLVALLQVRLGQSVELRRLLWMVVGYQACLLPALVANPYKANYIEWVHELFLVGGSLIVGWVVGNSGHARVAVGLYCVPVVILAVLVCLQAPAHHFGPQNFWIFQKNALGDMFAFVAIIAYCRPRWLGWRLPVANAVAILCAVGTLACQSRQGTLSIVAGVAIVAVRSRVVGRRSRLILLGTIPMAVVAYVLTANQLASDNKFNSANQRLTWYGESLKVWDHAHWVGVGLRWWYTDRFAANFQPPNVELEILTSAGIIGLAGFLIAIFAGLRVLWQMDPVYGLLPFTIVAVRLVQGQLDLYWVASQSSLPWLIVGVALGVQTLDRRRPTPDAPAAWQAAPRDQLGRRLPRPTPVPAAPSGP